MVFTLNTRRASVNAPIICLCNVLGAEQNAPARSKAPGCILWEPPPARCRVPTGEPRHGIRAPRFVPGSSQSPAPLPRPPAPRRAPSTHPSLALPPPGARHFGGRRVRGPPCRGPPGGGSAIAGCRALTMALSRVAARLCRPGRRRAPALRYRLRLRRARLPARGPGPAPGKEGAGGRCQPLRAKGTEAAGSPQPAAGFVPSGNKALHLL